MGIYMFSDTGIWYFYFEKVDIAILSLGYQHAVLVL